LSIHSILVRNGVGLTSWTKAYRPQLDRMMNGVGALTS
jgi:hypothetical protein